METMFGWKEERGEKVEELNGQLPTPSAQAVRSSLRTRTSPLASTRPQDEHLMVLAVLFSMKKVIACRILEEERGRGWGSWGRGGGGS